MKTSASHGESKSEENHHETIDFFRVIYSHCESGMVNLRFKQPEAQRAWNQFVNVNDIGDLPRILQKNQKVHCWFGVSLRNGRSGKKEHITLIPAVWLDHDDVTEEMEKKIREVLPPTAVVQTSEPTKRHYYWVLKEACGPEEIDLIEDINRRLVDYFGGCNGSWEAAHVMRIPGTFHLKDPKNPLKCTLLELNTSRQYNLSDFEILPSVKTESTNGYQGASSKDPNDRLSRIMKCEFLRHCDRERVDLPEPHWYAMVNILAHETGGKKLIHDLSIGYPKYSPLETDQKILHALDTAPYTCERIKLIWNCGRNCGVRSPIGLGSEKNLSGSEESKNLLWLPDSLMTGLAGDFADLYGNYVESPRVFLFFGLLTCLGSILSGRLTLASEISPPPRFYTVCLGESAVDRKSSGIDHVVEFLMEFFRDSIYTCMGVGSAEGLQAEITDTPHGRLLLLYDEFRAFISKCKIQASVLLDCVNTLFEKTTYQSRTKTSNIKVEKAHLSLLAATTIQTYQNLWTSQFFDIGFPNRLFLVPGRGKRKYSIPQKVPATGKKAVAGRIAKTLGRVGSRLEMGVDPQAFQKFDEWYLNFPPTVHTKRIDTYALRFMPLMALNEGKEKVDIEVVEKTISIMNWQIGVRKYLDPVDADNVIAKMEERVRRSLEEHGPLNKRDLKVGTHAYRAGLWYFNKAMENLSRGDSPEIKFDKATKLWHLVAKNVATR